MLLLGTLVLAISLVVALLTLLGMGRRKAVGDESEYLRRAEQDDPFCPQPFLRMPLLTWIAARCGASGEDRLRRILVTTSLLTVWMTAITGWYLGGAPVAVISALLLIMQPERMLLACHIWPDSLVALLVATISLLLVLPTASGTSQLLLLGVACALGALARIDFLVVAPTVAASLLLSGRALDGQGLFLLFAPTLLVLIGCTLRNHRLYGIALPDTTWSFNLMVTESEIEREKEVAFAMEPIIAATLPRWRKVTPIELNWRARQTMVTMLRRPLESLYGIGRRFLTLCGPDTFLRQKVLPRVSAYPELDEKPRRLISLALRVAYPSLLTLVVVGAILRHQLPAPYSWPAFSLMMVPMLFFARTRYRVALLPALSLLAAESLAALPAGLASRTTTDMALSLIAPILLWALLRIRCSRELPL